MKYLLKNLNGRRGQSLKFSVGMSDKESKKKSSTSRDAAVRPYVNSIAKPLAKVELCEKLFKAVKKGKSTIRKIKTTAISILDRVLSSHVSSLTLLKKNKN